MRLVPPLLLVAAGLALVVLLARGPARFDAAVHAQPGHPFVAQGADGEQSKPRSGPNLEQLPLETGNKNVPEFQPAFAEQTRAKGMQTRTKLRLTQLAKGFNKPWALAFLPDRRMLVTEKPTGVLYLVAQTGEKSAKVAGVPRVDGRDQGGLLDVAVAPDFADTQRIYLSYYEPRKGGNGLAVACARLVLSAEPRLEDLVVLFRMQPTLDSTKHAGGRIVLPADGTLFVTLGDRFIPKGRKQARSLDSDLGKIIRIRPDGAVPNDNPFAQHKGARPEIWTLGHRNVLGADLDTRGRLWAVEMGPRGGDELNLIERGKDYGWPTIGYGEEYTGARIHKTTQAPNLTQPVYYWDPVISPASLLIYSGKLVPEWKGNFFIAGLSSRSLVRLIVENDRVVSEERLLMEHKERIREAVEGPDGALYLLTDDENGKLLKLEPAANATAEKPGTR